MRAPSLAACCLVTLLCGHADAAGFLIPEQGAAATARATAVTAELDDPSTITYNPAGIAFLDGLKLYAGSNGIVPRSSFTSADTGQKTSAATQFLLAPNAYITYRVTPLIATGIGFATPFGLELKWPSSSPGRTVVRRETLHTFFISPVAAVNLSEWLPGLAVGAGVDIVPANVFLSRDLLFGESVGSAELSGSTVGVGARGGVTYRLPMVTGLSAGLSYRAPVKLSIDEGNVDIDSDPAFRSSLPPDGKGSTSLTLPQQVSLGVAYRPPPLSSLLLEVDGNWIDWSVRRDQTITFPDGSTSISRRDWHDTWVFRVGGEYTWSALRVRAGYAYDPTPIPTRTLDFTLPDHNRNVVAVGAGYGLPLGLSVDASVLWVIPADRTASSTPTEPNFQGTYRSDAWLFAVSIGYSLTSIGARSQGGL